MLYFYMVLHGSLIASYAQFLVTAINCNKVPHARHWENALHALFHFIFMKK